VYGALTLCGAAFQAASTRSRFCNSVKGLVPLLSAPTTPNWQRHQALPPARFRLFPFRSPLLRESLLLSSPRGTEMFQFPRFPLPVLCVHTGVTPHDGCRVSPFGHPRIEAWSAAPRGFSQPPASFIGFRRQGIHRWLFVAWRTKMLVLAMEFSRGVERATTNGATRASGRPPYLDRVTGIASKEATFAAPSKRNSEVRSLVQCPESGPAGPTSPKGGRADRRPPGYTRDRITSDRLGVPDRNDREWTP
jgi:hypothetical protein